MKPVKAFHGSIEGNLDGHSITMDLDLSPEGKAHLLSLMTDLYSDQELAICREYSTNARDANIMAGNGHVPIRVTTPNALSQALVIEDDGVGLDLADLENIYSKYGASNKRGSDDVNGMLGLGGKSALTYTSQFTVSARKDGVETQVVVTRNEDGVGVMDIVSQTPTTLGNGVKIVIPTKNDNSIHEKATQFFYFWKPGTVLVNGEQPKHLLAESGHTKIGDNVFVQKVSYYDNQDDIIVMGNVPYTLTGDHSASFSEMVTPRDSRYGYGRNNYSKVIVFVEMGDITFAPSREAASFTPRTMATIERLKAQIKSDLTAQIETDLTTAGSFSEAFTLWGKWGELVGMKNMPDVEFRGEKFAQSTRAVYSSINIGAGRYNYRTGDSGDSVSNSDGLEREIGYQDVYNEHNLCIVGYTNTTAPAGGSRAKVKQYIEDNYNDSIKNVFLFDTMPGSPWTDEVPRVEWETIKSIVLSAANRSGGGKTGKIPVTTYVNNMPTNVYRDYSSIGTWSELPIDSTKPIYYLSPGDLKSSGSYSLRTAVVNVKGFFSDSQIILLGRNRWEKFVKENPTAIELSVYHAGQFQKDMVKGLTADELFYADHDADYHRAALWLGNGTNDADLARLEQITKTVDTTKITVYNGVKSPTKVLDRKYPLGINVYNTRSNNADYKAHTIAYINAVIKEGI